MFQKSLIITFLCMAAAEVRWEEETHAKLVGLHPENNLESFVRFFFEYAVVPVPAGIARLVPAPTYLHSGDQDAEDFSGRCNGNRNVCCPGLRCGSANVVGKSRATFQCLSCIEIEGPSDLPGRKDYTTCRGYSCTRTGGQ